MELFVSDQSERSELFKVTPLHRLDHQTLIRSTGTWSVSNPQPSPDAEDRSMGATSSSSSTSSSLSSSSSSSLVVYSKRHKENRKRTKIKTENKVQKDKIRYKETPPPPQHPNLRQEVTRVRRCLLAVFWRVSLPVCGCGPTGRDRLPELFQSAGGSFWRVGFFLAVYSYFLCRILLKYVIFIFKTNIHI